MKKATIIATFFVFLSANLLAEPRTIERSISLTDPAKVAELDISLMSGTIAVEGYKGKTIEISVTTGSLKKLGKVKKAETSTHGKSESHSSSGRSTKGLKRITNSAIQLYIEERNNKVSIESSQKSHKINVSVKVPFNTNLELELHRGSDINVTNVHGYIDIENPRGAIVATGIKGPIVAESGRKDVTVVFDSFNPKNPSSLTAHRGVIDVTLPKKSKVNIEVKTYQGDIFSGIDAEFRSIDKVDNNKTENRQRISIGGAMAAKLNGGQQKLMLNTFRGDIYIREK
ncbi:hypothetical protein [Aliikangiella coralliicola]|uniref:DUF4097 domain-containing protein n=1 Tax=Aliikangiella coralliicola TaxID=2592383 RepID=A0A545U8T8_9GAMM|nr:hypothetical protein [Aliikangiella coralliicola]TQV85823.1 hypothetical protein FLL46_18020 [Aliikangiella coralliicola]